MAFEVKPFLVGVGFVGLGWLLFESGDTSQVCGRGGCNSGNSIALSLGSVGVFLMYASSGIGRPLSLQWLRVKDWWSGVSCRREVQHSAYDNRADLSVVDGKSAPSDQEHCDSSLEPMLIDDAKDAEFLRRSDLGSDAKFINIWRRQGLSDKEIVAYLRKKRADIIEAHPGRV